MKGKTLLCLVIVLSMTLILMPAIAKASPTSLELIFVDTGTNQMVTPIPPGTVNKTIGDSFDVELKVFDIPSPGLWSWMVRIRWNSSIINCTGVTEGPFLKAVGSTFWSPPRIVEGEIEEMASVLMVALGATGNGTLATITFEIVGFGDTNITIYESHLLEPGAGHPEIPHDALDGYFRDTFISDIRGPGGGPPDGEVDIWDFSFIGLAYGKTDADPDWDDYKIADTRGAGGGPPDGEVDIWDFSYCGLEYGSSIL